MKATANFVVRLISALFLAFVLWVTLATVVRQGQNNEMVKLFFLLFLFAACFAVLFFPQLFFKTIPAFFRRYKCAQWIAVFLFLAIGLAARLVFLKLPYAPTSDPFTFFLNATSLSQSGALKTPHIIGMFPFLHAYTVLLAAVFKVTGSSVLGVILLNTAFDMLAAFLVGHLIRLLSGSRKWAVLGSVLWWISPFNIIFCAISLPVIVVNALILVSLVLFVYLFKHTGHLKRLLGFSLLLAVALAAEDAFRPISIITILAVIVFYIITLLRERRLTILRNCLLSLLIILTVTTGLGYGWTQVVHSATGLPPNTHKQGWSIYMGSNYATSGGWNEEDSAYMMHALDELDGDHSKMFQRMQREGIARWKSLGPVKACLLAVKKSIELTGDAQSMVYNLGEYPLFRSSPALYHAMRMLCGAYWFVILGFALVFAFLRRREKSLDFILFMSILVLGLFFAFLAVEVANRYFTVFFPMFTVFSVLGLKRLLEKFRAAPRARTE